MSNDILDTCSDCYAVVKQEDTAMHLRWHEHLDRLIDIATGIRPRRKKASK